MTQAQKTEVRDTRDLLVLRQCEAAQQLESAGDYEAARMALSGTWTVIGERPVLDNLSKSTQAELLLRVGAVAARLGSTKQISGAQEFAKDLIAESQRLFLELGNQDKVSEALRDLALCYWREGAFDEGRVLFRDALATAVSSRNRLRTLIDSTTVDISSGLYRDALHTLSQATALLGEAEDSHRGSYHLQRAMIHKKMGLLDDALIEYSAASLYLDRAGQVRYLGIVENNIGFILLELNKHDQALTHLDNAHRIFAGLRDIGHASQVNETRARVFIAQSRYQEAERAASAAATELEKGGQHSLLAEALVTRGVAQARLDKVPQARSAFKHAIEVTDIAGDLNSSGRAHLVMIEELYKSLSPSEIVHLFREANERLSNDLDAMTVGALRRCINIVINVFGKDETDVQDSLRGRSLQEATLQFEAQLIERALDQSNGSITHAARLLGLTHQGLAWSLNHRHQELLSARTPPRPRRKSIIRQH